MTNIVNGHTKEIIQNFSVETIRNLLNLDNKGIAQLCSQLSIIPKKDMQGRTYFSKQELEMLRHRKSLNEQSEKLKRNHKRAYATVPVKSMAKQFQDLNIAQPPINKPVPKNIEEQQPVVSAPVVQNSAIVVEKICTSISNMEENITEKMSTIIDQKLDEKLDGMDEVIVELVRCKTENETLRYKMNELNKELYNLKNELSRYKAIGLGFYVKKNADSSLL